MVNGDRKEGICRLNVDGNGCEYLHILSDLETKLRNNTNPKEKIELALQGALMFYGADRAYVIEVDDELGIGVNTYECCAPGIAPEIDNLQFMPFEMFPRWRCVPFPVSWTVKMKKKQKETQDILSYHTQAAGCSDKARAKASGGRQPIEECGRTGL